VAAATLMSLLLVKLEFDDVKAKKRARSRRAFKKKADEARSA
jgi:hypothetical protein